MCCTITARCGILMARNACGTHTNYSPGLIWQVHTMLCQDLARWKALLSPHETWHRLALRSHQGPGELLHEGPLYSWMLTLTVFRGALQKRCRGSTRAEMCSLTVLRKAQHQSKGSRVSDMPGASNVHRLWPQMLLASSVR